jgi:hypothetical protein
VEASAGGVVALQVAASIRPPVTAVVNLSGERSWQGLDSLEAAQRLEVPALFAVAPGDSYVSVGTMRQLYEAAPVAAKRLVVLAEGEGHGWELLGGAAGRDGGGMDPGSPPVDQATRAHLGVSSSSRDREPSAETGLSASAEPAQQGDH